MSIQRRLTFKVLDVGEDRKTGKPTVIFECDEATAQFFGAQIGRFVSVERPEIILPKKDEGRSHA